MNIDVFTALDGAFLSFINFYNFLDQIKFANTFSLIDLIFAVLFFERVIYIFTLFFDHSEEGE